VTVRETAGPAVVAIIQRFARANQRVSKYVERRFEIESDKPLWRRFDSTVVEEIGKLPKDSTVVDVGGGRRCTFASATAAKRSYRLVSVDIAPEELALNDVADETRVGDIRNLPIEDGAADLIVSRTLLEHVDGNDQAVRQIMRSLRPGGTTLHLVPCRYALFAIAARVLPFGPLLNALHVVDPTTRGEVEFPVVYDQCTPGQMERLFRAAGAREVSVDVTYSQNDYFTAFFPAFLIVCLYQGLMRRLGLRKAATYMVIIARA
jgi:SAM-dependent methyltransferase